MCKSDSDRRALIAGNMRTTRCAFGEIDIELATALVGPAPRSHCAHIRFLGGGDLNFAH